MTVTLQHFQDACDLDDYDVAGDELQMGCGNDFNTKLQIDFAADTGSCRR